MTTHANPPKTCDLCPNSITTEFSDARHSSGRWGNFCPPCSKSQGIRYGTGLGQRYKKQADGKFLKVEG